jgi:putative endonuclease
MPHPHIRPKVTIALQFAARYIVILRFKRRISGNVQRNEKDAMQKRFYIYILANKKYGTLYIGVTSDLIKRIWEHKNHVVEGFTDTYNLDKLVYYEVHESANSAIRREKRLKFWQHQWKLELIDKFNPEWNDLYESIAA